MAAQLIDGKALAQQVRERLAVGRGEHQARQHVHLGPQRGGERRGERRPDPELVDMTRRFWIALAFTVPLFAVAMVRVDPSASGGLLAAARSPGPSRTRCERGPTHQAVHTPCRCR